MANPVVIPDALHTAGAVVSAQEARGAQGAFVAHDGNGPRLGVFYEGNQALIAGTSTVSPSMTVNVAPLAFAGQKASTEGVYVGRSTALVTVDVAAAPASNSRIDVVYVMQRDQNSTTSPDSTTQGEIGVVTGTAAVSPTKPAIPAGAVEVGTITIPAGATSTADTTHPVTVTPTCLWTAAAGAPIPVRNQTERDALSTYDGLKVYRLDIHQVEAYNGTAWGIPTMRPVVAIQTTNGATASSVTQVNAMAGATVTGDGAKRFRITYSFMGIQGTVAGDYFDMIVKRNGTQVASFRCSAHVANTIVDGKSFVWTDVPPAGSTTYTLDMARAGGTGTAYLFANGANPAIVMVEQMA